MPMDGVPVSEPRRCHMAGLCTCLCMPCLCLGLLSTRALECPFVVVGVREFARAGPGAPAGGPEADGGAGTARASQAEVAAEPGDARARGRVTPAPKEVPFPSVGVPLVYFHIPKTGGSTLDDHLWHTAQVLNLSLVAASGEALRTDWATGASYNHLPSQSSFEEAVVCRGADGSKTAGVQETRARLACACIMVGHFRAHTLLPVLRRMETSPSSPMRTKRSRREVCGAIGNRAFCPDALRSDVIPSVFVKPRCITILREPLARSISHFYHFTSLHRQCERILGLTECGLFSQLTLAQQLKIMITRNIQLTWLQPVEKKRVGKPIAQWVDDVWDTLSRCVLLMLDRWSDSIAMFNKMLPWALPPQNAKFRQPNILKRNAPNNTDPIRKGLPHELELLIKSGSLPHLCESLAPEIFFFIRANAWFDSVLLHIGISPASKSELHFCEEHLATRNVTLLSPVTNLMKRGM